MSFNIRYDTGSDGPNRWEHRRELVLDVCRERQPDMIGMQEPLPHQLSELRQGLPEYGIIGVARDTEGPENESSPIFYRRERFVKSDSGTFWLSSTPDIPASRSWGNTLPRICTWVRLVEKSSGQAFYHFNTYLDHQSQPSREQSIGLIKEWIAARQPFEPVIVTGDLNAREDNPIILGMKDALSPAPVDALRALHPQERESGTFHRFTGDHYGARIDYILVSHDWKILTAEIIHNNRGGRYPSDHLPITAGLRLERNTESG